MLADDDNAKVVLFTFVAGDGLAEHTAPLPAIIQIIEGEAELTVGEETVVGKPGTWIQMAAEDTTQHQGHNSTGHAADLAEIR